MLHLQVISLKMIRPFFMSMQTVFHLHLCHASVGLLSKLIKHSCIIIWGCVLARIWQYDTYQDTGITIQFIAIHCNTVIEGLYCNFFFNLIWGKTVMVQKTHHIIHKTCVKKHGYNTFYAITLEGFKINLCRESLHLNYAFCFFISNMYEL